MIRRPPRSPLFPYPPLSRSAVRERKQGMSRAGATHQGLAMAGQRRREPGGDAGRCGRRGARLAVLAVIAAAAVTAACPAGGRLIGGPGFAGGGGSGGTGGGGLVRAPRDREST